MKVTRRTRTPAHPAAGARRSSRNGRNGSEDGPRTARREETRRALLDAASRLFADKGYHATTVPDIVEAAGVGHGTFYEYFGNRRDILLALVRHSAEDPARVPRLKSQHLPERIRAEIFWYLSDHVDNMAISKVWHEASNFDAEVATMRRRERARRIDRVRKGIVAANARSDIDPGIAAAALIAMLEEFAHRWFVEGDGPGTTPTDIVSVAETLATMWLSAIGLDRPARAGAPV
jgi:AcrR family transcriptional regulator